MSRDISLNKVAPHLTASAPEVDKAEAVSSISSYVEQAKEQHAGHEEKHQDAQRPEADKHSGSRKTDSRPEIFKLIDLPDFEELFALSCGEVGSRLLRVVKEMRQQRGVTQQIPVADAKSPGPKESATYLSSNLFFTEPKGEQFVGQI